MGLEQAACISSTSIPRRCPRSTRGWGWPRRFGGPPLAVLPSSTILHCISCSRTPWSCRRCLTRSLKDKRSLRQWRWRKSRRAPRITGSTGGSGGVLEIWRRAVAPRSNLHRDSLAKQPPVPETRPAALDLAVLGRKLSRWEREVVCVGGVIFNYHDLFYFYFFFPIFSFGLVTSPRLAPVSPKKQTSHASHHRRLACTQNHSQTHWAKKPRVPWFERGQLPQLPPPDK